MPESAAKPWAPGEQCPEFGRVHHSTGWAWHPTQRCAKTTRMMTVLVGKVHVLHVGTAPSAELLFVQFGPLSFADPVVRIQRAMAYISRTYTRSHFGTHSLEPVESQCSLERTRQIIKTDLTAEKGGVGGRWVRGGGNVSHRTVPDWRRSPGPSLLGIVRRICPGTHLHSRPRALQSRGNDRGKIPLHSVRGDLDRAHRLAVAHRCTLVGRGRDV